MENKIVRLLLYFLLMGVLPAMAQEKTHVITPGEKRTIQSSVLEESRDLLVYTPGKNNSKLPLVIVFDGDGLFDAAVSAARFMNYYSEIPQMPEAIVIGIQNTNRNRDMPIPQQYGHEQGEDKFMRFITDELIAWANKNFKLNGHTIVIGHSPVLRRVLLIEPVGKIKL